MATKNTAVMQTALKATLPHWQQATWEDYLACCDDPALERTRIFYTQGQLLIDIIPEGINHASNSDLFTMLFAFWFNRKQVQTAESLGRCLIEKPNGEPTATAN